MLEISPEVFRSFDMTKPFSMDRQFDLVVSLEVAEHLPHESAKQFVDSLVSLGPVILFSAAIPFQGGTNHINEQWPHYWLKLFQEQGYVGIDCLRQKIWENDKVNFWYSQNMIIVASPDYLESNDLLKKEAEKDNSVLPLVHPGYSVRKCAKIEKLEK